MSKSLQNDRASRHSESRRFAAKFTQENLPLTVTLSVAFLLIGAGFAGVDLQLAQHFHRNPDWLYRTAELLSWAGQAGWYLAPAAALYALARAKGFALLRRLSGFLFLAVGLSSLATDILKFFIGRARPWIWFSQHEYGIHPFTFNSNWQSMPSGHATTVIAAVLSLTAIFPRATLPLLALGCAVAFSRVVVYAHYLSDVIVGALVAWVTVKLLQHALLSRRGAEVHPDR